MNICYNKDKITEYANFLGRGENWLPSLYTKSAQNYYKEQVAKHGNEIDDCSYAVIDNDKPIFVFIGSLIYNNGINKLLAYVVPSFSIQAENFSKKQVKFIKDEFLKIQERSKISNILYRDYLASGKLSIISHCLLSSGAKAISYFSTFIDLYQSEIVLRQDMRKSYRSLINWGIKNLIPQVLNSESLTWEHMEKFRKLHIQEARRITRSEESWRLQFDTVMANEAFVVMGKYKEELVTAGFFSHSSKHCYYGSSASKRDMFDKPLFHALMWTAILYAKKLGCHWLETGERIFSNHLLNSRSSEKEFNISHFKAGFGGETKMILDLELEL